MDDTKKITEKNNELIDKISNTIEESKNARRACDEFDEKYKKF